MRNYLALLGWGYDEDDDLLHHRGAAAALLARARLEVPGGVRRAEAALDERPLPARADRRRADARGWRRSPAAPGLRDAVAITQEKISTLDEFWPLARSFFDGPVDDPTAREKFLGRRRRARRSAHARAALAELPEPWTAESVEAALRGVVERSGRKPKQVFQPLRVALTGTTVSPGIFETVALLGRDETLARIDMRSTA